MQAEDPEFSGVWKKRQKGYNAQNGLNRTAFLRANLQRTKAKLNARLVSNRMEPKEKSREWSFHEGKNCFDGPNIDT